jgi:hypothetical protein
VLPARRQPVKLAFATTTTISVVVQRAVFAAGRGHSVAAKHNPFTAQLKFPAGRHHARFTLAARIFVTAPHHTVRTIRWPLRLC